MVLAFKRARTRTSTPSSPAPVIRQLARVVQEEMGLPEGWINDGAKAFVSSRHETAEGRPATVSPSSRHRAHCRIHVGHEMHGRPHPGPARGPGWMSGTSRSWSGVWVARTRSSDDDRGQLLRGGADPGPRPFRDRGHLLGFGVRLMRRPRSLAEVATWSDNRREFSRHLADFLDQFYLERNPRMLEEEPPARGADQGGRRRRCLPGRHRRRPGPARASATCRVDRIPPASCGGRGSRVSDRRSAPPCCWRAPLRFASATSSSARTPWRGPDVTSRAPGELTEALSLATKKRAGALLVCGSSSAHHRIAFRRPDAHPGRRRRGSSSARCGYPGSEFACHRRRLESAAGLWPTRSSARSSSACARSAD